MKRAGYLQGTGPPGRLVPLGPRHASAGLAALNDHGECDTFTCGHCQRVVLVPPRCDPADMGGLCKQCMTPICPRCLGRGCTPFEKKLEQREARDRALRSYGLTV